MIDDTISAAIRKDPDNDDSIPTKDYQSNPGREVDELITSYRHLFSEYEVHWSTHFRNNKLLYH